LGALGFGVKNWQERHRIHELVLASGGKIGEYYAFSQAFAAVVNQNYPNIHSVIETDGSGENMSLLSSSQVELALVQSDTPVERPVRAISRLFPEMFHLLVRTEANIQTVADLRGKRVALMPEGSGSYQLFWPLAEHYGLQATDIMTRPLPPDQAYEVLLAGQADALFRVISLGNESMQSVLGNDKIRLLAIDQVEALRLSLPYLEAETIPKGTYDGGRPLPAQDLPVVSVHALLVVHEEIPNEIVNALTNTLFTYRNELVTRYPRAALIRLPTFGSDLGLPLHPGAKAFYDRDEPSFLAQNAEPMSLMLSVGALIGSGFWQLHLRLTGRQKNRADRYNLELLEVIEQINQTQSIAELDALRKKLFLMLKEVVSDLDSDRISSESFEAFSFPWKMAMSNLRHQEILLKQDE
jgi:TRAP transporter TAXI family solute receptor